MMISYGYVYKRNSKPVMKGSSIEKFKNAIEEYKILLAHGWEKT